MKIPVLYRVIMCAALASVVGQPQTRPVALPIGERADLAALGHLKSWEADGTQTLFSHKSGQPWTIRASDFGVEWDEPREINEIRAASNNKNGPGTIVPEYWVSQSSKNPPGGGQGGWTLTDSPWVGSWQPISGHASVENGIWIFRCAKTGPLRTLKVRLRFDGGHASTVSSFQVFGTSRWNVRDLRIETGCEGKPPFSLSTEAYNGRIIRTEPEGQATRIQILYLEHFSGTGDRTVLTIRTPSIGFGISLDDLIQRKSIYIRHVGMFVADAVAGATFASYTNSDGITAGADVISQVSKQDEQSLQRAISDIPRLTMRDRSGSHPNRYIPVGVFANREKYGIEFNGNIFVSKHGSKVFEDERKRMEWKDDTISFRIGTGAIPDFREREGSARQSVLDDDKPIIRTEWSQDGLTYREEAFATLLDAPLEAWQIRGDEVSALLIKLTVTNSSSESRAADVWFHVSPQERLEIRDGLLEAVGDEHSTYDRPRFRAALKGSPGQFSVQPVPVEAEQGGAAPRWSARLNAGETATLNFAVSFRTLHDENDLRRASTLDYDSERTRVIDFWSKLISTGARLHVPDEEFNRFYRSVLQHILLSVQRDVPTGLYMDPCGTYDYNMFANETDIQVRWLDMRGLPDLAAKFVEPFLALQGSKPFPGGFHQTDAVLHGVRVDAEHDYTHSGYNLNHGWTLWTAAEYYMFTRDRDWLRAHLPKLIKAADWIVSERAATKRVDEEGKNVWEYGLLPPGQLEDNEEWQYWFAVNAYAYRGLREASKAVADLDPATGNRLAMEADHYREDIRNAAFRSMAVTPVAPLRDGTWVPVIPSRTHLHGRDVGWIRNILYGAQVLTDCGVFSPDEPVTSWIIHDLEDNLFMAPDSFSVAEQDWFSRGAITLQPNLVNMFTLYLDRDEIPQALRAFYNTFAVSYYPDVNMFTEWVPSFGKSGGPFFKTAFLTFLRQMLVHEQGDKLYLSAGAPRQWFRPGQEIEFDGAPTYFGKVSVDIESHSDQGHIDATVEVPNAFRGNDIVLRLRHPEKKPISRVEVDGQRWARFDKNREIIFLPSAPGTKHVTAFY
jgi:hypothetical protein